MSAVDSNFNLPLMKTRRLLQEGESLDGLFERVEKAFLDMESLRRWDLHSSFDSASFKNLLQKQVLVLGTPIMLAAGNEEQPMSACVVIPVDLREEISSVKKTITPYFEKNMGSGFDLTNLDDPVATLIKLNQFCLEIEKSLERPPANMALLHISHPKILEFINCKTNADFYKWRFNLSVVMDKKFLKCLEEDSFWTVLNEKNEKVEMTAREVYGALIKAAHYCGEPGVIFMERFENDNPTPQLQYSAVAPCAEVGLAKGEVCQFSYINLSKLVKEDGFDFQELIKATNMLVRVLDDAVEISIKNTGGDLEAVRSKRRIGIGVCGVADMFIKLGIEYGSEESGDLLAKIMEVINFNSKKASVELAKERGSFELFNESRYQDEEWFFRKGNKDDNWQLLYKDIRNYGLRNAQTTSLPPTGTSSRVVFASNSIEPRFSLCREEIPDQLLPFVERYLRNELQRSGVGSAEIERILHHITVDKKPLSEIDLIPQKVKDVLKVAKEVDLLAQLHLLKKIAPHIDESVSKTINLPNKATIEDVQRCFDLAINNGLKGITIFRDGCLEQRDLS